MRNDYQIDTSSNMYRMRRVTFDHLRSKNPAYLRMKERAQKVAVSDRNLLVTGETGTGKNFLAQAVHNASDRAGARLDEVNLASVASTLAMAELFGVEKGAYTGATEARLGAFRRADGGTLFLDEVTEASHEVQKALLRAVEHGVILPVGSDKEVRVDVRIIAATNRPMRHFADKECGFARDLLERLSDHVLFVPSLRDRQEDFEDLLAQFVRESIARNESGPMTVHRDVVPFLRTLPWNGNLRTLSKVVNRCVALSTDGQITADLVREQIDPWELPEADAQQSDNIGDVLKRHILMVWHRENHVMSAACQALSMPRSTLRDRLKAWGEYNPERDDQGETGDGTSDPR